MKGMIGEIPLMMIVGLIVIMMAAVFMIFFKVHIKSLAVDVVSVNRYQEIPTTVLSNIFFVKDSVELTQFGKGNPDKREKEKINCFQGDGPAGAHTNVNEEVCTKRLSFLFSKQADGVGTIFLKNAVAGDRLSEFLDNLKASLPANCYALSFGLQGSGALDELTDVGVGGDCNLNFPKFDQTYPIPVMTSSPAVADQRLRMGSSVTRGEELLVTWPRFGTHFDFGGG